jgi:hypothetical protein
VALILLFSPMGFLFPLFLLAGLAIAIPFVIHLFNLRKYKRVDFPDTRFLRDIQLSTKRQAKIQNFWLMVTRMAFIIVLVLAFAQPFFTSNSSQQAVGINAIYIDNSYSMELAAGQRSLLQQAKQQAKALIQDASTDRTFIILSNDKPSASRPLLRDEALAVLEQIQPTARPVSLKRIIQSVRAAQNNERAEDWNLYLFTDLQKRGFITDEKIETLPNTNFYVYPLSESNVGNVYIDTAYFLSPTLDVRKPVDLVVGIKKSGNANNADAHVKVVVNDQVRAVSNTLLEKDAILDTLALQLDGKSWQQISVCVQDHPLSFDDTFRIAARTSPELSILVIGDEPINPYLQAAFKTYDGFKVTYHSQSAASAKSWQEFGLVVLQNLTSLQPALIRSVSTALAEGGSVLWFPGKSTNVNSLNAALQQWGDISLELLDTSRQEVVSLQPSHDLVQDLFEKVPDNVMLPVSTARYPINASMVANQQGIMTYKDGKPFLAQYSLDKGKLFLCASPLDDRYCNFPLSHFFVPILYKMAMQSGGNNIYAVAIGGNQSIWLPGRNTDSRTVYRLRADNYEAIPPQSPVGSGVALFPANVVQRAGFYSVVGERAGDSTMIALNADRKESSLSFASKEEIEHLLKPQKAHWLTSEYVSASGWEKGRTPFPIWKLAVLLGLMLLGVETWLMLRKPRRSRSETMP